MSVEIVTQKFQLAVDLFAETILAEAKGCQGSNQLLLRRVVIDFPLRQASKAYFPFCRPVVSKVKCWRLFTHNYHTTQR